MLQAALDRSKSLDALQQAAGSPRKGYEVHHIVEKSSAKDDGFSREQIDGPDNIVSFPAMVFSNQIDALRGPRSFKRCVRSDWFMRFQLPSLSISAVPIA